MSHNQNNRKVKLQRTEIRGNKYKDFPTTRDPIKESAANKLNDQIALHSLLSYSARWLGSLRLDALSLAREVVSRT